MLKLIKFIVLVWFTIFFVVPLLIGLSIHNAHSAPVANEQIVGSLTAVTEVRTMNVINTYCHYVSQAEVKQLLKQTESFAGVWIKQYPYLVGDMDKRQLKAFSTVTKEKIKSYCATPAMKKYFMSMYNTYAANEGSETD